MKILKELRNINGYTQIEIAKKLSLEQNTISQYENKKTPSFKILPKLSTIFNTSIDYLLLENKCYYPRSFNFIEKALKFEIGKNIKYIEQLSNTITTFIQQRKSVSSNLFKKDIMNVELKDNFHENLKILRNINNLTQKQLAKEINVVYSVVGMYEIKIFPSIDKIKKLSDILNCSIHALITGEKIFFDFNDKEFEKTILLADHLLSIEEKSLIIKMMENLIK